MARAILRVCFKGLEQKRHTLEGKKILVGRDRKCGIVVDNQSISAQHFELINHGPNHWVKDLGSANGTYVNGSRVDTVCLRNLDEIVVGKYTLVYENAQASSKDLASKPLPKEASLEDVTDEPKASRSTYVMDQAAVQAYVEQMAGTGRNALASGGRGDAKPPKAPDSGTVLKARQEVSSLRKVMYLLAGLVTVLILAVAYLVYLQLK